MADLDITVSENIGFAETNLVTRGDYGTTSDPEYETEPTMVVIPVITLEADGIADIDWDGEGDAPLPVLFCSGEGLAGMVASGQIDLPPPALEAAGLAEFLGTAEVELPALTCAASDIEAGIVLPMLTLDAEGFDGEVGESELSLPALKILAIGSTEHFGTLEVSLPVLQVSGSELAGMVGEADLVLPHLLIDAQGVGGEVGEAALELPVPEVTATGIPTAIQGTASLDLPVFVVEAGGSVVEIDQTVQNVVVINLSNMAISEYTVGYTGYFFFDGKYFGVKADGIYLLEGATDNSREIETEIEKTGIDMASPLLKRATDAYLKFRSTGDLKFEFKSDKKSHTYVLHNGIPGLRTQKIDLGKGMKGRHLGFNIKNLKGSTIRLNEIHFLIDLLKRRAHDE